MIPLGTYAWVQVEDSPPGAWVVDALLGRARPLDAISAGEVRSGNGARLEALMAEISAQRKGLSAEDAYRVLLGNAISVGTWRFGWLLDQMSSEDIAATPKFISEHACDEGGFSGNVYCYAWYFSEAGRGRLIDMAEAVDRLPPVAGERSLSLRTNGLVPLGDDELDAVGRLVGLGKVGLATFVMSREAVEAAGGVAPYCRMLHIQQGQFYGAGLLPHFIFRCTPETTDFMTGEFFRALCFSGIYPRNLYLQLCDEDQFPLDMTCELYRPSWSAYRLHARRLGTSAQHQVFDPFTKGLPNKLRAMLRDGRERPDGRQCPFSLQSAIFGAGARVASCPVVHGRAAGPDGERYQNLFWGDAISGQVELDVYKEWIGRGPESVGPCKTCAVAPLCGSGCPLTALEEHGELMTAPCPPIAEVIQTETVIAIERRQAELGPSGLSGSAS